MVIKIDISSRNSLMGLHDVLLLLKVLNSKSKNIAQEEIVEAINAFKNYLEITPDFNFKIQENTLRRNELIDYMIKLYFYLANQDDQTHQISDLLLKYIHTFKQNIKIEKTSIPFKLIDQIKIEKSTGYVLETTSRFIVIHTETMLTLYDKKRFELLKHIALDFIHLYSYYKHFHEDKIILYYANEIRFLLFIDLNSEEKKLIPISNLINKTLSPIYVWQHNKCIISTYDEQFLEVDIEQGTSKKIKSSCIHEFSYFKTIFSFKKEYIIQKIDSAENYIVFEDKKSGIYRIMLIKDNIKVKTPIIIQTNHTLVNNIYHDFNYKKGIFVAVAQQQLQISNTKEVLLILKPEEPFEFYRAKFLDEQATQLAILIGSKLYSDFTELILVEIDYFESNFIKRC